MGRQHPDDGPHLVYLPERTFDMAQFLADVKATYDRLGRCVIAVSEGIHDASGEAIATQLAKEVERDAHGNVQLSGNGALADVLCDAIKSRLKIKRVRGDTFGYLQRSFLGCVSDVDQQEARMAGEKALAYALGGATSGSVAIQRAKASAYAAQYALLDLKEVAGKTRVMEDAFINAQGNNVTEAFLDYLRPLLGSGMSHAHRLAMHKVGKA
jgi:6-phosphofructokinase 1